MDFWTLVGFLILCALTFVLYVRVPFLIEIAVIGGFSFFYSKIFISHFADGFAIWLIAQLVFMVYYLK